MPCSNCKRNSADCLYTEAQQSRSTWGDSPLSKEKVKGILVSCQTGASPNLSEPLPKSEPSDSNLDGKAAPTERPSGSGLGPGPGPGSSGASTKPTPTFFNPGVASEEATLDRRKQVLTSQSKQISKAIRVAHPIPRYNTAQLFQNSGVSSQPPHNTQPIVNSQIVAQDAPIQITISKPHNSIPKTTWINDTGQEQVRRQSSIQGTQGLGSQPYQRQQQPLPSAPKHLESQLGHGSDPSGFAQNTLPYYRNNENRTLMNDSRHAPNSQTPMDYTFSSSRYPSFSGHDPHVAPSASTNSIDTHHKQVSSIQQRHLELSQQLLVDEPKELSQNFNYATMPPPSFNVYPQQLSVSAQPPGEIGRA